MRQMWASCRGWRRMNEKNTLNHLHSSLPFTQQLKCEWMKINNGNSFSERRIWNVLYSRAWRIFILKAENFIISKKCLKSTEKLIKIAKLNSDENYDESQHAGNHKNALSQFLEHFLLVSNTQNNYLSNFQWIEKYLKCIWSNLHRMWVNLWQNKEIHPQLSSRWSLTTTIHNHPI